MLFFNQGTDVFIYFSVAVTCKKSLFWSKVRKPKRSPIQKYRIPLG
jgi:hypothetical protein